MVTSARTQFVADLNAALYDFLVSLDTRSQRLQKLPLIILTLSDPAERAASFVNKMFP